MKGVLFALALWTLPALSAAAPARIPVQMPDGKRIEAELALTPEEHEKGLMYRTSLARDRGMLFVFREEEPRAFWMKNTWIALDIVFIGADKKVVRVFENVPRSYPDTPESKIAVVQAPAQWVLELAPGAARRHKLRAGSKLVFDAPPAPPGPPSVLWSQQEALKHLRALVAMDTRNPPGNELPAARYLAGVLQSEGLETEVLESTTGRGLVIARLRGTGAKRPILLLSHLDTVGFERTSWTSDPLQPVLKDGYLYARGAVDNKGLAAVEATTLIALKRRGAPLSRDVIFAAVPDEELGGAWGARWLLEKHRSKVDAEFALNEGGSVTIEDGYVRAIGLQAAEKLYHDVRVSARGESGHGSAPSGDSSIYALSEGLAALRAYEPPFRLNAVTRAYFAGIAPVEAPENSKAIADLLSPDPERAQRGARTLARNPRFNAMLRDTVAPTILRGGFATNVIPSSAEANLNCRLLPDTDPEAFLRSLQAAAGSSVTVAWAERPVGPPPPLMSADNDLVRAVRAAAAELAPGSVVVPYMSAGATDSEHLRRAGILSYGFDLPLEAEDHARMHGDDERVPVGALGWGTLFLYRVIEEVSK